jgi:3-isopropylmalate dehydratase small subunit
MDKFTTLEGVAAPLKIINVDTDMVIPKQYLKTIKRTGLGTRMTAARTRISSSTSRPTATPKFWSRATISAAVRAANTRRGRCWISASVA